MTDAITPALIMMLLNIGIVIIAVTRSHEKQSAAIDLVRQDLDHHKGDHNKLEQRVSDHEEKIDKKLEEIQKDIRQIRDIVIKLPNQE